MIKIGVLVSGGGTNLQALIDSQKNGLLKNGEITLVISSKKDVYALERAKKAGIKAMIAERSKYSDDIDGYSNELLDILKAHDIELVVLAGFLSILSEKFINIYNNKIINVHPALIPSFCGKGFYGLRVHKEALAYGVKISGATVHLVNEVIDGGRILAQKAVEVKDDDTPETLQKRIMEQAEQIILPEAVEKMCCEMAKEQK